MVGTNDAGPGLSEFHGVNVKDLPGAESNLFSNVDNPNTIIDYRLFESVDEKRYRNGTITIR